MKNQLLRIITSITLVIFSVPMFSQIEQAIEGAADLVSALPLSNPKPFGKKTKDKELQTFTDASLVTEGKFQKLSQGLYIKYGEGYPKEYMPEWDFGFRKVKMIKEGIDPDRKSQLREMYSQVALTQHENKVVLIFKPEGYYGLFTYLMAEIELPKNKLVYVSDVPQTFDLDNFKQITFDENDQSIKVLRKGGTDFLPRTDESGKWVGQVILKIDKNGNLVTELGYIIYGSGNRSGANYKLISNGLVFRNTISREKALNLEASNRCLSGDCENGLGEALIDSCNYEGAFLNGKPDGKGKIKLRNGDFYQGDFREGKLHGYGEYRHSDGRFYKGNFTNGKMNGIGAYNRHGLTEISYWENGNKGYSKGFSLEEISKHQDSVFKKFKKCDCLSKSTYTTLGFSLGYGSRVYESYYGGFYETEPELTIAPKFEEAPCLQNTTSGNIYIKAVRKVTTENNEDYYFDESYIIEPNGQVSEDLQRINSFFGTSSSSLTILGQYCEADAQACSMFTNDANLKSKFDKQGVTYTVGPQGLKTTLKVTAGNKVYITANGSMRLGTFAGASGPGGKNGFEFYNRVAKCKHGALMVRIGNSELYCVGNQSEFTAKNSGTLEFIINDIDSGNNSGEFEVKILVVK
jgi:hypothetical protein